MEGLVREIDCPVVGSGDRREGHRERYGVSVLAIRLEAGAADHRADFERERERADRLTVELLQATAETMAAKEVTARLEDEVAALRTRGRAGGSIDSCGLAASRLAHLAATIVEADRKACR